MNDDNEHSAVRPCMNIDKKHSRSQFGLLHLMNIWIALPSSYFFSTSHQGFLRNMQLGRIPPLSGADDAQANCIARLAPLVAAFAGHPDLYR